jgi:hypothetical protein
VTRYDLGKPASVCSVSKSTKRVASPSLRHAHGSDGASPYRGASPLPVSLYSHLGWTGLKNGFILVYKIEHVACGFI